MKPEARSVRRLVRRLVRMPQGHRPRVPKARPARTSKGRGVQLPIRWRMATIAAGSVLVAMLAAIISFNCFEAWQLEREAMASLEEAIGWESGDAPLATRSVEFLFVASEEGVPTGEIGAGRRGGRDSIGTRSGGDVGGTRSSEEPDGAYTAEEPDGTHPGGDVGGTRSGEEPDGAYAMLQNTELEEDLLAWFLSRRETNPQETNFAQRIALAHGVCYARAIGVARKDGRFERYIAYVDVTAQTQLMRLVNVAFVAIAILTTGIAVLLGWRAGKNVEEANEAQTRFYENMSHELKTPLAAIRGYAEGSLLGVVEQQHASTSIVRETERMSRQVEQILDMSRLEAGAIVPQKEEVVVAEFIQDCLMPFEGIARMRNIDVRLDLGAGVVRADVDLFAHALENVLSNAMRHAASFVAIRSDAAGIEVENDGDIPSTAELNVLFDRFHSTSVGGTGIGLALTREIVELHGWHIEASVGDATLIITIAW